jgi:hypothetical protein
VRFDEFIEQSQFVAESVDQFDGFVVEVAVPPEWEPFDSSPVARVWVWRADPSIKQFCTNAVLTMTRLDTALEDGEIFDMLCEWQLQIVPGSRQLHRELTSASDGPGIAGSLIMQFPTEYGDLKSSSQTRVISTDEQTFVAQLTLTSLHDSPRNWENLSLIVRPAEWGGRPSTWRHSTAPTVQPVGDHS